MDEFAYNLALAFGIVAVECLHGAFPASRMRVDSCRHPTAWAFLWHHILILSTVKVVLDMRDNHIPFGYQDAAAGMQFKVSNKSGVVEAGS
jgi:hypothetical protein